MSGTPDNQGRQHNFTLANEYDIYFPEKRIVKPSPEHLIQAGFGSPIMVTGLIDDSTNHLFGDTIDEVLMERLQSYRALLGGESRGGKPLTVVSDDGKYSMHGGTPTFIPVHKPGSFPWETEKLDAGVTRVQVSGSSIEDVARISANAVRAQGATPSDIKRATVISAPKVPPVLEFSSVLGGDGFSHALAKSLFNQTAFAIGPQRALSDEFREIRAYVLDGVAAVKGEQRASGIRELCRPNSRFTNGVQMSSECDLRCTFAVRGSSKTGIVYGLATLYGYLSFSCLISDRWTGDDFMSVIEIDPHPLAQSWQFVDLPLEALPTPALHVLLEPRWSDEDMRRANFLVTLSLQSAVISKAVVDLRDHYRGQGMTDEDAMNRALQEALNPPQIERKLDPQEVLAKMAEEHRWLENRKKRR